MYEVIYFEETSGLPVNSQIHQCFVNFGKNADKFSNLFSSAIGHHDKQLSL